MKITKQARAALFVMLLAISILPGCGKNKNQDQGVAVGVAPVGLYPGQIPGTSGFAVTGQLQVSQTGNFSGSLSSQGGSATGAAYSRNNGYDQIVLYINGNNSGYATATAVVSLSQGTLQGCGGGMNYGYPGYVAPSLGVANVQFNLQTVNPINGTLVYSSRVTLTNGCPINI